MQKIESSPLEIDRRKTEWAFYAFSIGFDDASKLSTVTVMRNKYYETHNLEYFYREVTFNTSRTIGHFTNSFKGFLYSFAMYNYKKSSSQMLLNLGVCQGCSACPISINHCLPSCNEHQYVDSNGNCQGCLNTCKGPCSRSNTCNLCHNDLCYLCTKYEVGACTKCVDHAFLNNGECECENGYFKEGSVCTDTCQDGFFFDSNLKRCMSCQNHCKSCSDQYTCKICFSGFILEKKECRCPDGYFLDSKEICSQCDKLCLTCSINSTNCESCAKDFIIFRKNACYPCESFQGYGNFFSIPFKNFTSETLERLSKNCGEICDDGKNMGQKQCDDGNSLNRDGCSENCMVENGWSCSGGNINSSDICQDTTPPFPILSYLNKTNEGYSILLLSFSELVETTIKMEENIEVIIDNVKKFEWGLELLNKTYIINLIVYENVPSETKLLATFISPEAITDKSGNHMNQKLIEIILSESFTYKLSQVMKSAITTATATAIASGLSISIFSSNVNLQGIWGMIEMMQIQNYLIFLSLNYPANLKSYLSVLGIANGNFLPNPFQIFLIKNDPFPEPPESFLNEGFNTDFLMNSGEFIILWIIMFIGCMVSIVLYKLFPNYRFIKWFKKSYFYSFWLRIGIESFLGLCLSIFLQWRQTMKPTQNLGYFSIILSFLVFIYIIITYILVIWQVSTKNINELNKKSYLRRFGVLYENFKKDRKIIASFLLFQNTRRMLFTVICVFLYEFTKIQAIFSFLLLLLYMFFLILLKPYNSLLGNIMNISSEILYFLSHCIILKFLDNKLLNRERTNLGWAVILLLSSSLLIHLIGNFIEQIKWVASSIVSLKDWVMKNFHNSMLLEKKRIVLDASSAMIMEIENSQNTNYLEENKEFSMENNTSNEQFSSVIYTIQEESYDDNEVAIEDL